MMFCYPGVRSDPLFVTLYWFKTAIVVPGPLPFKTLMIFCFPGEVRSVIRGFVLVYCPRITVPAPRKTLMMYS